MNWTSIIKDLLDAGMAQAEIGNLCGISQGHVSDLLRGKRKEPGHALGERIRALHAERCQQATEAAA